MEYEIGLKDRSSNIMSTSPFFFISNPLVKSEYLYMEPNPDTGKVIGLRPVYIIGDLEILHDWRKADSVKTNWKFNTETASLYRHYKYILGSPNAQSCMIEKNHIPIMQIDLLQVRKKDWPPHLEITDRDYAVFFLFMENFREPDLVKNGFNCLLECLLLFSDIRFLYFRLLQEDKAMEKILDSLGCKVISGSFSQGEKALIFRKQMIE